MTIDEAISHAEEVAERYERMEDSQDDKLKEGCLQCAADHRQLAEWLTELKELKSSIGAVKLSDMKEALELIREYKAENATLREENKVLISECDRLIREKGELLSKVSGGDVLRICQLEEQLKDWKEEYANLNKISYGFYKELKEAKELLKMAVEDLSKMPCNNDTHSPDSCYICAKHGNCSYADSFKWCKADIALKLIGETNDKP